MTDACPDGGDKSGSDLDGLPETVGAAPEQLLTGLPVGLPTLRVLCIDCGEALTEGQSVVVSAYRCAERATWDLRRCYCPDCAPAAIGTPTLGVTELLVRAWLGTVALPRTRTHRLCLTEVELIAYSPPGEGATP